MDLLTVAQVANSFNVSTTYIYRLMKERPEMRGLIVKKGKRRTFLKPEAIEFLSVCISSKPVDEQFETSHETTDTVSSNQDSNLSELIETLKNQLETKDSLINELVEKDKQERQRSDTILMTLSRQIADQAAQIQNQSLQLEDLRRKVSPPPAPRKSTVVPLRPVEPSEPHPMASWTPLQLLAIKFFQPWKLRRDYREKKAA